MMSPILAKFFNSFSNLGLFPSILKTGIVSPVFKKDNPQLFENYRPISTLPIVSQLFKKIIYKRIYAFLIAKNILYKNQFGFRKTTQLFMQLITQLNMLLITLNRKNMF